MESDVKFMFSSKNKAAKILSLFKIDLDKFKPCS